MPIIVIRFGVKKLKSHSRPNRPTMPRVIGSVKTTVFSSGSSPATIAPNTMSSTMIAAVMPIPSPNARSSSEMTLKSSDELTTPSMKTSVPSIDAASRAASTSSMCGVASSRSPA